MKANTPPIYRLKDIERNFGIPIRKLTYLIRHNHLVPQVENNILFLAEDEVRRYLGLPEAIRKKHHVSYLKTLGPGLITGASDDDPSGIGTYSAAGAAYGLGLSWLALYTLPMMTAVQETVSRIGIVTGKGLSAALGKRYGKKTLFPLIVLLLFANTVNIGANIGAMVASLQLLLPINFALGAVLITLTMIGMEVGLKYHRYSKVLKILTVSLLAYIITGFMVEADWAAVFRNLITPSIQFELGYLLLLVAVLGTTISPYLFFWQASEEVEEITDKGLNLSHPEHHKIAVRREIKEMRKDTLFGMSFANVVFLFIQHWQS